MTVADQVITAIISSFGGLLAKERKWQGLVTAAVCCVVYVSEKFLCKH
jgi:hypothetical protein